MKCRYKNDMGSIYIYSKAGYTTAIIKKIIWDAVSLTLKYTVHKF